MEMEPIQKISDIDVSNYTGRMLVAAISLLSTESLIPKSYNQAIKDISDLAKDMYGEIEERQNEYTYSV